MNKNSAVIWFNAIKDSLPVPKTILVEYNHPEFIAAIEGNPMVDKEEIAKTIDNAKDACNEIGWPCFVRSDLTSAKHSGPSHYLIKDESVLSKVLFLTAEDNEMKLWPFSSPTHFMIREFLKLNYDFTAFSDLPIAREFRLFADNSQVYCIHPYWPEETLEFKEPPPGWQEQLKKHHEIPDEVEDIKSMAIKACSLIDNDKWSVDFAQDINGKWWLIDMAHAEDSYHWEGCINENFNG